MAVINICMKILRKQEKKNLYFAMAYRNKQHFCLQKCKLFAHSYCFTEKSATFIQVLSNSMKNLPEAPVKATSTRKGPGHRGLLLRVQSTAQGSISFIITGPKFPGHILPQLLDASCGITEVTVEWQENWD